MTQNEHKIDVEENEESESIALEPLRGAKGKNYLYYEMYSQNEIN